MNAKGLVLMVFGVWVGCQVFGGHAFQRLNILPAD